VWQKEPTKPIISIGWKGKQWNKMVGQSQEGAQRPANFVRKLYFLVSSTNVSQVS